MSGLDDASSSEEEQLWQDGQGGSKSPDTRQGGQGSQGQELEKGFIKVIDCFIIFQRQTLREMLLLGWGLFVCL